jgi:hypothetical protein
LFLDDIEHFVEEFMGIASNDRHLVEYLSEVFADSSGL